MYTWKESREKEVYMADGKSKMINFAVLIAWYQTQICRWLAESEVTVHHQPRVWIDYVSEIITRLL